MKKLCLNKNDEKLVYENKIMIDKNLKLLLKFIQEFDKSVCAIETCVSKYVGGRISRTGDPKWDCVMSNCGTLLHEVTGKKVCIDDETETPSIVEFTAIVYDNEFTKYLNKLDAVKFVTKEELSDIYKHYNE